MALRRRYYPNWISCQMKSVLDLLVGGLDGYVVYAFVKQ